MPVPEAGMMDDSAGRALSLADGCAISSAGEWRLAVPGKSVCGAGIR